MTANKSLKILSIIAFSVFFIISFSQINIKDINDDVYFSKALEHKSLIDFLHFRYLTWSGRVTLEGLLVTTINFPFFWKIMIPSSVIILCLSASRIIAGKINAPVSLLMLIMILSIPPLINEDAIFWVTGAYNYILPFSLAIYSMSVFFNENSSLIEKLFAIISLFICGFNEQSAFFVILICISLILTKRAKISPFTISYFLISLSAFILMITAPGNYQRALSETPQWMPDFYSYSLALKLMMGIDRLNSTLSMPYNFPMLILSVLIIREYLFSLAKTKAGNAGLFIIALHIVLSLCLILKPGLFGSYFFQWGKPDFLYPDAASFVSIKTYLSFLFTMLYFLSISYIAASRINGFNKSIIPLISIMFGSASIMMLSFSPTVYASYFRVQFMFEIFICVAVCKYLYDWYWLVVSDTAKI